MLKQPPRLGGRQKAHDHNGTRSLISSTRYQKWRKTIALKKGNRCEVCWERDHRLTDFDHMHHILPRETHPELTMDEDNVMLLCVPHHDEIHGKKPQDNQRETQP